MSVFFTADTHFGHEAIIRYCNRPFDSVETMNQTLLEMWNAVVRPTGTVYHLGDVFFRSKDEERTLTFVRKLHGKKYLVPGNHDQAHQQILARVQAETALPAELLGNSSDGGNVAEIEAETEA